jgi:putative DNA primase/helicase
MVVYEKEQKQETASPPTTLPFAPENIPRKLTERPQWVAWKWKRSGGGWTKIPVSPGAEQPADITDPETWKTFEAALTCYARMPGAAGVGYVFSSEDPYVGIDLDDCREPATEKIEDWAARIVREIDSYAELSPSGTGVKIFARGEVPGKRRRKGKVEMYDHPRFFTTTGRRLEGTPKTITDGQEAMKKLYRDTFGPLVPSGVITTVGHDWQGTVMTDQELLERAKSAGNGEKFGRLWTGDANGYASDSEADLALCSLLAFWVGPDVERLDRLFRQSGLCREKWLWRADYRERTIKEALKRGEFQRGGKTYARRRKAVSLDC